MNKVGVIGLGILGSAVAEHLYDQVFKYQHTIEQKKKQHV